MRVLIPLADGVEELEAVTVIDVLRRGGIDVTSAALGDALPVKGSRGVTLLADAVWAALDLAGFDALVLPGGGKGTENLLAETFSDGSRVWLAQLIFYRPDNTTIEGSGVQPDRVVDQEWWRFSIPEDPQVRAAVEEITRLRSQVVR